MKLSRLVIANPPRDASLAVSVTIELRFILAAQRVIIIYLRLI